MSGRIIFEGLTTQEPQAVNALAAYLNKPVENGVLDLGDVKLVRSSKGDCFYTVSKNGCSCKAGTYGRMCRHKKALASGKWATGGNGPALPEDRPKASSSVGKMLIDAYAFETLPGEIEYWQTKEAAAKAVV